MHGLPEHPLFAKGYRSIGCAPCTTIVAEGEDPRAGRWRGLNKKECGIHFDFNGAIAKPVANVERNLWTDGAFIADPDDSGPGTNSFAGMSGIPGSATQPAFDPDGPFTTIGGDFFVSDEFANPQAPLANYSYIMIVHY